LNQLHRDEGRVEARDVVLPVGHLGDLSGLDSASDAAFHNGVIRAVVHFVAVVTATVRIIAVKTAVATTGAAVLCSRRTHGELPIPTKTLDELFFIRSSNFYRIGSVRAG
jgi:hypothetical protein